MKLVIVATVSLAIMLTNELAVPLLVRRSADSGAALLGMGQRLRLLRQTSPIAAPSQQQTSRSPRNLRVFTG